MNNDKDECIKELDRFFRQHEHIYVYGTGINQLKIKKYLESKGYGICGFVISDDYPKEFDDVMTLSEFGDTSGRNGIIVAVSDKYYNDIIRMAIKDNVDLDRLFFLPAIVKNGILFNNYTPPKFYTGNVTSIKDYNEFYTLVKKNCKRGKYNILCHEHLGDTLILLGLSEAMERDFHGNFHYILNEKQKILPELYEIKDYSVLRFERFICVDKAEGYESGELEYYESSIYNHLFSTVPQLNLPFVSAPIEWNSFWDKKWETIVNSRAQMFGMDISRIKPPRGSIYASEGLCSTIDELGGWDKIVLVAPEARANPQIPLVFWERIVNKLKKEGFTVVCNAMRKENKLEGTIDLDLSVSDLIALGQRCHEVHSTRSGLCDCLAARGCALHVYYTNDLEREFEYYSLNNNFYLDDPVTEVMVDD